jgi:glutathione S-transferase
MITLHHLRIGRSIFTVWLLEEIGADYELEVYHRHPETMRAPQSLKDIHPLGKSPVIDDDGLVLSESGAITDYLLNKYDADYQMHPDPKDAVARATYSQWLAYPEGSVFAPLLIKMLALRSGIDHPVLTPFAEAEIKLHFDHIANHLGSQEFILGDEFSGADFGIAYMVSMAERLGLLGEYASLRDYLQRMQAREGFKRAIEKAVE